MSRCPSVVILAWPALLALLPGGGLAQAATAGGSSVPPVVIRNPYVQIQPPAPVAPVALPMTTGGSGMRVPELNPGATAQAGVAPPLVAPPSDLDKRLFFIGQTGRTALIRVDDRNTGAYIALAEGQDWSFEGFSYEVKLSGSLAPEVQLWLDGKLHTTLRLARRAPAAATGSTVPTPARPAVKPPVVNP